MDDGVTGALRQGGREGVFRPTVRRASAGLFVLAAVLLLLVSGSRPTLAQQVPQPTPAQMQLLNQLPPEQRQQALDALHKYQEQQRQLQQQQQGAAQGGEQGSEPTKPGQTEMAQGTMQEEVPRAEAGSSLVISLTPKLTLLPEDLEAIDEDPALAAVKGSHFYELDDAGVLLLPGLPDIPLLGLTVGSIEQRLGAEPALAPFEVRVSLLSTESIGAAELKPFGYEMFQTTDTTLELTTFEAPMSGPVPVDYVLGPGDNIRVQLFGNTNNTYELEVSRDGTLNIPELGPLTVAGLQFSEFRKEIEQRVQQMLIGTQVSVTMGELRTIRVFVVGDVNRPGSYVVSSLATISSVLYRSGGVSEVGSLRDIQLKRQGKVVAHFDLYDLLLKGDTSDDHRLQQGDAIFVPPIGTTVGIGGEVRRPAIYEVKGKVSIAQALELAGGLSAEAFPEGATLQRIGDDNRRSVLSVDAASDAGQALQVRNGDTLMIPRVLPVLTDTVVLKGNVYRPGPYEWHQGMRLTDLIPTLDALKPDADPNYLLIRRENQSHLRVDTVSADLEAALVTPQSADNVLLQPRDTVNVFNLEFGRQRVIQPILEELKRQANFNSLYEEVQVAGRVRAPGSYPLHEGMRISDLIRAGGKLAEGAYTDEAELTRFTVVNGEFREKKVITVDLDAVLRGDTQADLVLSPYDHLKISSVPYWDSDWTVTVDGEVRFPGEYQILRGETLSHLMQRVGGLTEEAFSEGAIFLRVDLKEREKEQIEVLANRLQSDLVSTSLETLDTTGTDALSIGQSLLTQLRATEPVGRLVIDLNDLLSGTASERRENDLELKDGDQLLIPRRSQSVTVLGETQYPASHLYQPGFSRDDYIERSGGLTRRADEDLIYVVRASGAVVSGNRSSWFRRGDATEIRPGDTIVVPLETDRMRPLTFWTNVSQIFYQTAIAVAAIRTFNN